MTKFNEYLEMVQSKPKHWNSMFATKVIDAYKSGKLTKENIKEWEKEYNGGNVPNPPLNTAEILDYYINTKTDPRGKDNG